jgi:N utilization substance protein A
LAAKLLGWKIDIKSEEEKRQEVQNATNLLMTGVPVSTLIEYGLPDTIVDALVKGDIGTVEKLGSMTPEQLQALEGVDEESVNRIMQAINAYYGTEYAEEQADPAVEGESPEPAPETVVDAAPEAAGETATEAAGDAATEAEEVPNSIENTTESASGTMNEPVESAEPTAGHEALAEGESAAGDVLTPDPHEPQAGR